VVRHGSTGWLVKARDSGALAEAMSEALGSREELERRGRAGRAMAEAELSRPAVIARTVALYRELLGARWPVS
jgi:glycosyltransferase involved in cell wall biosynthesis